MIKSRRLRWAGHVASILASNAFKILTCIPAETRPLGTPRRRREDNIRVDLKEVVINTRDWVDLAQGRAYCRALVNATLSIRVP